MSQDSAVLQRIPSLGDVLGVSAPPSLEGKARRVSLMGPLEADELDPKLPKAMQRVRAKECPPLPPAPPTQAEEIPMPKGVYPRKALAAKADQPGAEAKPVTEKRKKPAVLRKAKKLASAARAARSVPVSNGEANFVVDDAGRIAIIDGDTRIDLSLPATKRLATFVERTKSFRS